jgi:outer membrane protein, multidrug efflux system
MKRCFKIYTVLILLTGFLFVGCKVTHKYQQPAVLNNEQFRDQQSVDSNTLAALPYPEVFNDTVLQSLIREGIQENLDLKTAYTRIRQSEAYFNQSRAAFFPT